MNSSVNLFEATSKARALLFLLFFCVLSEIICVVPFSDQVKYKCEK